MKHKKTKTTNQKGFSFSFDGIVAALVIFGVISFIAASTLNGYEFSSQKIVQKQLADDILDAGTDTNSLQSLDSGKIDGFILANLPTNYNYQLVLRQYNAPDLNLLSTSTFGSTLDSNNSRYVETKKIFSTYYASDVNAFYSATLRVWLK